MATQSIVVYGCPIWERAMQTERTKNKIKSVQRIMALRTCNAYCTTSTDELFVVAGLIPFHLLAAERRSLFCSKGKQDMVVSPGTAPRDVHNGDDIREDTINQWQNEWNASPNGKWTRRLIKEIKPWIKRKWGQVGYYMCSVSTTYLKHFINQLPITLN